jgi:hypothetical protein
VGEVQATGILIIMFALRCVLPLALVLLLGYFTNRLVDRWEAEATAVPRERPVVPAAKPNRALPCWLVRQCDPARQATCAAARNTAVACWVARTAQEGHLPANCDGCPVYNQKPLIA